MSIFIFFFLCHSCVHNNEQETQKNYYSSGNIKLEKIYENNNLKLMKYYYDLGDRRLKKIVYRKGDYDSIINYYKNQNIYQKGNQNFKGLKYGNWYKYTKEGYLSVAREYFIIKNKSILNRTFYYNKKGDTVWYAKEFNRYNQEEFASDTLTYRNSTMILFNFYPNKDTINIGEPFAASVRCNSPLARNYNSEIEMLLAKEDANYNKEFSNENEVKFDTFPNLLYDGVNREYFPNANPRYVAVFGRWFDTPGKKILRGYMREYFSRKPTATDSIIKGERKVYFEKTIFVKDTSEVIRNEN